MIINHGGAPVHLKVYGYNFLILVIFFHYGNNFLNSCLPPNRDPLTSLWLFGPSCVFIKPLADGFYKKKFFLICLKFSDFCHILYLFVTHLIIINTEVNDLRIIISLRKSEVSVERVLIRNVIDKNGRAQHTLFAILRYQWRSRSVTMPTQI